MRYLFLFLLVLFAVWWVRRALSGGRRGAQDAARRGDDAAGNTERMLECAHCGVHVPEREGVSEGRHFYCSEAHRRLGPGRGR